MNVHSEQFARMMVWISASVVVVGFVLILILLAISNGRI